MIVIDGLHPRYPGNWDHLKFLGVPNEFLFDSSRATRWLPTYSISTSLPTPSYNIQHNTCTPFHHQIRKISYTKPGLISLPTYDHAYLFTLKRQ